MRWTVLFIFTIVALSSHETFARDCDGQGHCRKSQMYRTTATYLPPLFIPVGPTVGPVVGCYGFDHGPIYSPYPCNFPYPCEYYGTCKAKPKA